MPQAPLRPCLVNGCAELVKAGRCDAHARDRERQYDRRRPRSDALYDSAAWRRFRIAYLSRNPLCAACLAAGKVVPATEVDHVVNRRDGGPDYEESNLQALCVRCHARKGARDGTRWRRRR